ncbi:signal peptide peptidase-like 3 [Brachionus plicatilis]|uniref:Signal peptide peptidase-like 3 n=1 Tax=Brachionus plicatilis TaxID=10195 RepID=A0A3M7T9V1_BRAPC|nr:signal peptide peptidase-like 3 [Brachionus plicatilis]
MDTKLVSMNRMIAEPLSQESQISVRHSHNQDAFAFSTYEFENRSWIKSTIDSSHLITFFISILIILYASFKSLNNELDCLPEDEFDGFCAVDSDLDLDQRIILMNDQTDEKKDKFQTINSCQALFIPILSSISLLVMFFYFDSFQTTFVICTSVLATISFSHLLSPVCTYFLNFCFSDPETIRKKRNLSLFGSHSWSDIVSFFASIFLVALWIITGHWIFMDLIGIGFCVVFISMVRLPSLKVSLLLLFGLVIYDVIWVYFSKFIFNSNVMVKVATKEADNPFDFLTKKLNIDFKEGPKLSLPGKLVIPSYQEEGNYSILGLGDIVIPGLLLCFVLRFDAYKRNQMAFNFNAEKSHDSKEEKVQNDFIVSNNVKHSASLLRFNKLFFRNFYSSPMRRWSYFRCSLFGYFFGLFTATLSSEIFREAQPALLFLVPSILFPLMIMAYLNGDLNSMWNEPFGVKSSASFYV